MSCQNKSVKHSQGSSIKIVCLEEPRNFDPGLKHQTGKFDREVPEFHRLMLQTKKLKVKLLTKAAPRFEITVIIITCVTLLTYDLAA